MAKGKPGGLRTALMIMMMKMIAAFKLVRDHPTVIVQWVPVYRG